MLVYFVLNQGGARIVAYCVESRKTAGSGGGCFLAEVELKEPVHYKIQM